MAYCKDISDEPMEEYLLGGELVYLPQYFEQDENVLNEFFSFKIWDKIPESVRRSVMKFMPNFDSGDDDITEKRKSLKLLFEGSNIFFGNPLSNFKNKLLSGQLTPDAIRMEQTLRKIQRRRYKVADLERKYELLEKCLIHRKKYIRERMKNTADSRTLNISTPDCVLKMSRKSVRRNADMSDRISRRYFKELSLIRQAVGEDSDSSEDENYPKGLPTLKENVGSSKFFRLLESDYWKSENPSSVLEQCDSNVNQSTTLATPPLTSFALESSNSKKRKLMLTYKNSKNNLNYSKYAYPSGRNPRSFFGLIRYFFSHSQTLLSIDLLAEQVRTWQAAQLEDSAESSPISWIQLADDWETKVPSAVAFLSGYFPYLQSEKFRRRLVEATDRGDFYCWNGNESESEDSLKKLTDSWWTKVDKNDFISSGDVFHSALSSVSKRASVNDVFRTDWTVRPCTSVELIHFRSQERNRYAQHFRPFTYKVHGYLASVGPVKDIKLNASHHHLLVTMRPKSVSFCSLVLDAVARLPNGFGTRADVLQLLLDSQYLIVFPAGIKSKALVIAVSIVLDGLQTGRDPYVGFDRKLQVWNYLHWGRTESDYADETAKGFKQGMLMEQKSSISIGGFNTDETSEAVRAILPPFSNENEDFKCAITQPIAKVVKLLAPKNIKPIQPDTKATRVSTSTSPIFYAKPPGSCAIVPKITPSNAFSNRTVTIVSNPTSKTIPTSINIIRPQPIKNEADVKTVQPKKITLTADNLKKLLASGALVAGPSGQLKLAIPTSSAKLSETSNITSKPRSPPIQVAQSNVIRIASVPSSITASRPTPFVRAQNTVATGTNMTVRIIRPKL